MYNYLCSFIWPQEEEEADQKQLRQKFLVLQQIKNHRIRLKNTKITENISVNPRPTLRKIHIPRPLWTEKKKMLLP